MNKWTAALLFTAAAAFTTSCGGDSPSGPDGPGGLSFVRADQTEISFSNAALLFVWCGPWEEGSVSTQTLHAVFGGPGFEDPTWRLRAVVDDVTIGQPLAFPNNYVFDQPKDVDIFIFDPPNELSTQDDDSSGSITFQKLQCQSGGEVEFSIDAVIGSEFGDGPSVNVAGAFRGTVGEAPAAR